MDDKNKHSIPLPKIIRQKLSEDGLCATFFFEDEGHTMGNILKYLISKSEHVEFCGYSIPHPNKNLMTLRIEAKNGYCPINILKTNLKYLIEFCNNMKKKFKKSMSKSE